MNNQDLNVLANWLYLIGLRNTILKKLSVVCYVLLDRLLVLEILCHSTVPMIVKLSTPQLSNIYSLRNPTGLLLMKNEEICYGPIRRGLQAILGTGQYVLKEKYVHLAVPLHLWFTSFLLNKKIVLAEYFRKLYLLYVRKVCCNKGNARMIRCFGVRVTNHLSNRRTSYYNITMTNYCNRKMRKISIYL